MDAPANPRLKAPKQPGINNRKPVKPRQITKAELAYANTLVRTADTSAATKVARELGDPDPANIAKRTPVRELLQKAFEKHGFTIDYLVKHAKQQVRAKRPIVVDGIMKMVPDGPTRQKAIADGFHVHGAFEAPPQAPSQGHIILYLSPRQKIMIENLRGEPLPPGSYIDVEPKEMDGSNLPNAAS